MTIKSASTEAVKLLQGLNKVKGDAWPTIYPAALQTIITLIESLTPIVSGEMVVVPRKPTENMIEKASFTIPGWSDLCDADLEDIYCTAINAYEETPTKPLLARNQLCGCIVCICSDPDRCHGCGARHCGKHEVGEFSNPVYKETP
jgi:hypothetical protein